MEKFTTSLVANVKNFYAQKGYKISCSGCFKDDNLWQPTLQIVNTAAFDRCLKQSNFSIIDAMYPSKEKKVCVCVCLFPSTVEASPD